MLQLILHNYCNMLSKADFEILPLIKEDVSYTFQKLEKSLRLSPSQTHHRWQKLDSDKVIANLKARIDSDCIGSKIEIFLSISTEFETTEVTNSFCRFITSLSPIRRTWILTGNAKYLLPAFCQNLIDLQHLTNYVFPNHKYVTKAQRSVVLDQTKQDSPLPIPLN